MDKTNPTFNMIKNITFFSIVYLCFYFKINTYLFEMAVNNADFKFNLDLRRHLEFFYNFNLTFCFLFIYDFILNLIVLKKVIKFNIYINLLIFTFFINTFYFNFISISITAVFYLILLILTIKKIIEKKS